MLPLRSASVGAASLTLPSTYATNPAATPFVSFNGTFLGSSTPTVTYGLPANPAQFACTSVTLTVVAAQGFFARALNSNLAITFSHE